MNVIWIVADTWRQDHVGAYGNKDIHTPSLDALAAKSVRFDSYYAGSFPTMPTRADHHTGRWTMSFMGWGPLPEGQVTLAQTLVQKGFTTAAAVDTPFYLRAGMNYDRGFQAFFMNQGQLMSGAPGLRAPGLRRSTYTVPGGAQGKEVLASEFSRKHESWDVKAAWRYESDHCAPQTFTLAMQWLERHYKEDFFLYVDTWDPHEPWDAPAYYTELYWPGFDGETPHPLYGFWQDTPGFTEEMVRKAHAAYCGEVTMVDTWIGHVLRKVENMGLMEKTAIIFTTDHGIYLGEHGGMFGKMQPARRADGSPGSWLDEDATWGPNPLYNECILIPLLVYIPGTPPGVYDHPTSPVDVMPTVLDILGQDIPGFVQGSSLLPKIRDTSLPGREFVVSCEPFTNPGDPVRYVDNVLRRRAGLSMITVTAGEWSFLYSDEPESSELYNLSSDPRQEQNVISHHPEIAQELHQYLVRFMHETNVAPDHLKARSELKL